MDATILHIEPLCARAHKPDVRLEAESVSGNFNRSPGLIPVSVLSGGAYGPQGFESLAIGCCCCELGGVVVCRELGRSGLAWLLINSRNDAQRRAAPREKRGMRPDQS